MFKFNEQDFKVKKHLFSKKQSIFYKGEKLPFTATWVNDSYLKQGHPYLSLGNKNESILFDLAKNEKVSPENFTEFRFNHSYSLAPEEVALVGKHSIDMVSRAGYLVKQNNNKWLYLHSQNSIKEKPGTKIYAKYIEQGSNNICETAFVYAIENNKYKPLVSINPDKMFASTYNLITNEKITDPYELLHSISYYDTTNGAGNYAGVVDTKEFSNIVNNHFNNLEKSGVSKKDISQQQINLFLNYSEKFKGYDHASGYEHALSKIKEKENLLESKYELLLKEGKANDYKDLDDYKEQNDFGTREYRDYIKSSDSKKELLNMVNSEYKSLKKSYIQQQLSSQPKNTKTNKVIKYRDQDMGREM